MSGREALAGSERRTAEPDLVHACVRVYATNAGSVRAAVRESRSLDSRDVTLPISRLRVLASRALQLHSERATRTPEVSRLIWICAVCYLCTALYRRGNRAVDDPLRLVESRRVKLAHDALRGKRDCTGGNRSSVKKLSRRDAALARAVEGLSSA